MPRSFLITNRRYKLEAAAAAAVAAASQDGASHLSPSSGVDGNLSPSYPGVGHLRHPYDAARHLRQLESVRIEDELESIHEADDENTSDGRPAKEITTHSPVGATRSSVNSCVGVCDLSRDRQVVSLTRMAATGDRLSLMTRLDDRSAACDRLASMARMIESQDNPLAHLYNGITDCKIQFALSPEMMSPIMTSPIMTSPIMTSYKLERHHRAMEKPVEFPYDVVDDRDEMADYKSRSDSNSDGGSSSGLGGDAIHACPDCGKAYSTTSNLARHRQIHRSVDDKKARKCPHCDKLYVSSPAYSMHVRTHNQGCACPHCGKRFSRPWLLQGHIRTHTGEKPFECPKCGKTFADKSNLRAHIQTHSSEKPYVCGRCGKGFALKSYLYKHEESSCMRSHRLYQSGAFHHTQFHPCQYSPAVF